MPQRAAWVQMYTLVCVASVLSFGRALVVSVFKMKFKHVLKILASLSTASLIGVEVNCF